MGRDSIRMQMARNIKETINTTKEMEVGYFSIRETNGTKEGLRKETFTVMEIFV